MIDNDKITEILTVAKKILESELDWCQGLIYRYEGECSVANITHACALGALDFAVDRVVGQLSNNMPQELYETRMSLYNQLTNRLESQIPGKSIPRFNDDPYTSKEDILLMFKRAIENV